MNKLEQQTLKLSNAFERQDRKPDLELAFPKALEKAVDYCIRHEILAEFNKRGTVSEHSSK